ncbi:MAG TPA: hypothetical protein EYH06_00285 [Chromatiales bacterium]|nr:hypothetical protein [Thiotrichales bacterium]HIP67009.1 hypothetical protein [Chromatiales bacterium]
MRVFNLGLALFFCFIFSINMVQADSENSNQPEKIFITEEGGMDRLGEVARQRGWRVERDDKGNLLLFPGTSGTVQTPDSPVGQKIDSTNLDALQKALAEKGWGTGQDENGNLLLYPPGLKTKEPAEFTPAPRKSAIGDLDLLEKMLGARGWRTSRDEAGNLLLYPITTAEKQPQTIPEKQPAESRITLGSCLSDEFLLKAGDKVSLPVDRWAEARVIAQAWLDGFTGTAARIGKIRQVNRLYLVSIVKDKAPYNLLSQLVIDSVDGRLIAVP